MSKVLPGQRANISARTFNSFVDAAEYVKRNAHNRSAGPVGSRAQAGVLLVLNDSGFDLDQFECLETGSPVIGPHDNEDEFCDRPCFNATIPTVDEARNLVVLMEPLAPGKIGRALAVGMTPAFITRDAGEDRMTAGTVAGDTALSAGGFGAEIVWEETVGDPTVAHWAFVRLPAAEPSSGGATPLRAQIKGIYGDYLQVALWNPDMNGGNGAFDTDTSKWVLAARPWILRTSVTSRNGESYTFNGTQTRTAVKSGYANETQKITPDYVVGDEIRVSDVDSTGVVVAVMELTREDTNSSGRKWAQSQ